MPVARLKQRVFTNAETLDCDVGLHHFGTGPLQLAKPRWAITDASGRKLLGGSRDAREVPIGKNHPLGHVSAKLDTLPTPASYKLVGGLEGKSIENGWDFWLYLTEPAAVETGEVLVTGDWRKVLFTPKSLEPSRCPPMRNTPVFWNIQMTVRPPKNRKPRFPRTRSPTSSGRRSFTACARSISPTLHPT